MNHDVLVHHGILGQKWGIRRYQNEDGTLTEAGKKRYYKIYDEKGRLTETGKKEYNKDINKLKNIETARTFFNKRKNAYDDLRLMGHPLASMIFEPGLLISKYWEAVSEKTAIRVGEKRASKILSKYGDTDLDTYSDDEADLVVKYMLSKYERENKRKSK